MLVLGAATAAPGVPGPALRRRLEHGVGVFFRRDARYLLVSGGIVGPPPAEAHVMGEMAVALGIDPGAIVIEDQARNTFENAVYAGRIIRRRGWRQVVLVTDGFHVPRARYVFSRLGLTVAVDGVPRSATTSRASWVRSHLDERLRLVRTAALFALGAHKPLIRRVWNGSGPQ
ncbi:MAG: YdcF family protein [Rhodospirillales bacterium]